MKTIDNKPFWYNSQTSESFNIKPKNQNNVEYWDSILEFKVYEVLLKELHPENIKRQHEIIIWEKSSIFPKLSWTIDFKIFGADKKPIYVEAKGKWLINHPEKNNFWKTLRLLQMFQPEVFNRLLIVGDNSSWMIPHTKIFVYPYKNVNELIKAMVANG